jgi:NAD+ synthase (glutamine-hydrolysing)
MKTLRIASAALNQTPLDWAGNRLRILQVIEEAKAQQVGLLCLPELAICGYGCEDAFMGMDVCERSLASLQEIAPHCTELAVTVGLPLRVDGLLYNVAAFVTNGRVQSFYAKQHLAGDGLHYEPRWFKPWPENRVDLFRQADLVCPVGDIQIRLGDIRIGFEICEDAWVANRPIADGPLPDIVLNPSASHFAFGKHAVRQRIVTESARALQGTYVYANLLGNEAGRIIYDGATLIATPNGLVAEGPYLEATDTSMTVADVDLDLWRRKRAQRASQPAGDTVDAVQIDWEPPQAGTPTPTIQPGQQGKEAAFTLTVALGLIDYIRKSRSKGVIISLSGGADSAAVACLAWAAWNLGERTHGPEIWRKRMGLTDDAGFGDWCYCVYQSTGNSGQVTLGAAKELAEALGATFHHINVQSQVDQYLAQGAALLGRELTWEQDDIALQNIQARVRAPGVWLLANVKNCLLLSTSNRSEAAVGYATMDGDTCGGLSPIAGIDKAFLRQWLRWMETDGLPVLGSLPVLSVVNRQTPTAELRPQDASQTDEDDLMPYPILDTIERLAIGDKYGPLDCLDLLASRFPDYGREQLLAWTRRFFQLWARNQWKRERYAPSFHLDDQNLDPKTWCRFPILSGGFTDELKELN